MAKCSKCGKLYGMGLERDAWFMGCPSCGASAGDQREARKAKREAEKPRECTCSGLTARGYPAVDDNCPLHGTKGSHIPRG
jgi:predicted  nucleic acid-binding Zn-ribbon protein